MPNFKELIQLRGAEQMHLALIPTGIASVGDYALVCGELLEVAKTDWIDVESTTCAMIAESTDLVDVDAILQVRWEKEEEEEPDANS